MFAYTSSSYPVYSPPTLYSHAPYIVASPVPTARERYLRAVADAQAARARYMSELEEQHILARLRQQEALRQAEDRQRQIRAFQNELTRRRLGRIYAENLRRPVVVPQVRRPAFARQQRASFLPASTPETPLDDLEAFFAALLRNNVDEEAKPQDEKARPEQAENATVPDDSACFLRKLEAALEAATQTGLHTHEPRPAGNVPPTTPASHTSRVPLTRRAEIPRNHLACDRAARTIQQRWRSRSADAAARNDAVATIATLRARFQFLRDTFSFPEHLEFKAQEQDQKQEENMDTMPTLLFTPANAAVHTYIHELTKLLTLADAVSSRGSERVREERRSFVRLVEEALDSVERRVATVWGKKENATVTPSEGADALVTSSTTVPIINTPQCAGESGARSSGSGGDAITMIGAEPRASVSYLTPPTTTPIIDLPQPAGGSVSQSSGVTLSTQGGDATTADAEPRVSESELASCHDSDALTDVSTIVPSRVEMVNKHKEAVPADVIDAGDDDQASQWPVRDDVVGEETLSLLGDGRDLGRLPAREEGGGRQGYGVTTGDTLREDEDHAEAVRVRLDSADTGEVASRAFASAPSPSPLSGSSQLDLVAEGENVADEHDVTPASAFESVPASGSPAARDAAMAVESFDVVYPDSSSSSSVAVEDDAGARDAKRGDGEDEEGFELV